MPERRRDRPMNGRGRIFDIAVLLPVGAVVLFIPPYIRLFDQPMTVLGIPLLPLALFSLWLVGIVLTGLAARSLRRADDVAASGGPAQPPDGGDSGRIG